MTDMLSQCSLSRNIFTVLKGFGVQITMDACEVHTLAAPGRRYEIAWWATFNTGAARSAVYPDALMC